MHIVTHPITYTYTHTKLKKNTYNKLPWKHLPPSRLQTSISRTYNRPLDRFPAYQASWLDTRWKDHHSPYMSDRCISQPGHQLRDSCCESIGRPIGLRWRTTWPPTLGSRCSPERSRSRGPRDWHRRPSQRREHWCSWWRVVGILQ